MRRLTSLEEKGPITKIKKSLKAVSLREVWPKMLILAVLVGVQAVERVETALTLHLVANMARNLTLTRIKSDLAPLSTVKTNKMRTTTTMRKV